MMAMNIHILHTKQWYVINKIRGLIKPTIIFDSCCFSAKHAASIELEQILPNLDHIAVYHKIQVKCDYSVFHIYRSWIMALFLLENRDFLGFRMIFKVWLNQICSNYNTMLLTIKYRLSSITVYFTFTVPELWPFFS
jgi:hypothetical protein